MLISKKEAIKKMNFLGSKKEPFTFLISFDQKENLIEEINSKELLYKFNKFSNLNEKKGVKNCKIKILNQEKLKDEYRESFLNVQKEISFGNTYLLNLTKKVEIETNLNLDEIFDIANAKYKIKYKNLICFSPETFIKINKGVISTYPMKGTVSAELPNAKESLIQNKKEQDEHATIVDLLRNDLNLVSKDVTVKKYRYLTKIKSVIGDEFYQLSTEISGNLPKDYSNNLGDIIYRLLPAGSISGAPKTKTVQIINSTENYNRGFYTGIAGHFDGENLDSCVLIRFIEKENDKLFFKTGGGITHQSLFEDEFRELLGKIYVPVS